MSKIGLSLDRSIGGCSDVGDGSSGKEPGMRALWLLLDERVGFDILVEICGGNLASVHGTPRKLEKKEATVGEE